MIENLSDWIDISSKRDFSHQIFIYDYLFDLDHLNDEQNWTRKYVQLDVKEHRLRISSNEVCHSLSDFSKQ